MNTLSKTAAASVAAMALSLMAAGTVSAQAYYPGGYGYSDPYRQQSRSSSGSDVVVGAVVGAIAGAVIGEGDGRYVAGGALAGAAVAAASGNSDDCGYYRDGRCYRNVGHWEREHGINSRDYNSRYSYDAPYGYSTGNYSTGNYGYSTNGYGSYGYGSGYGQGRYDPRYSQGGVIYTDGQTYPGRGYYRDGRFWRNHGEWRSNQNRRDTRYERRW